MSKYVEVIFDVSIDRALDYAVPGEWNGKIKRGMRVEAPIRGRPQQGYVFSIKDTSSFPKVSPLTRILSENELITEELFDLALWMAKYYCTPLNRVFKMILPAVVRKEAKHKEQLFVMRAQTREEIAEHCKAIRNKSSAQADVLDVMLQVKKGILLSELLEETGGSRSPVDTLVKKGFLKLDIMRIDRSPLINEEYFQTKHKKLNPDQAAALEKINSTIDRNAFETHLLYGVTGSGKTEIYLQAIDKALKMDKGTIMLVPEISLTAQTIERFRSRFEGHIAILHHRLGQGERFDEWHRIYRGEAKIVIGARSAIFSPVKNLGLIIVDEEHESSYKQNDDAPSYHARDIAVMRGKMHAAAIILGSATPSLESYHNALSQKYILSKLESRADAAAMPKVTIVDMKHEFDKKKGYTNFSDALLDGIKKRVESGEQVILFLNRRGYHTTLFCQSCQNAVKCNHCDTSLTFHLGSNSLACHLCGFSYTPPPAQCPACKCQNPMKYKGVGTEQIQKAIHALFPDIRSIRLDADTTKHKGSHQKLLREFGSGKADVLIGTQMIAKGLHFPQVTLVGVLNSDSSLNIPDFRASETSFQLITQVAGRAGRGALAGEVIIQTFMPDNSTIRLAAQQNYEKFFEEEMAVRKIFNYPPYKSMVKITLSGSDAKKTYEAGESVRSQLMAHLPPDYEVNPVIAAGHAKLKDKFKFQFLVRGSNIYTINRAIEKVQKPKGDLHVSIDVNPTSTFF